MGNVGEFSLATRVFLKAYRWREIKPVPWTPLRKALTQCSVALVSTSALVLPGQEPFDGDVKGGDYSFRVVPAATDLSTLIDTHRSQTFDHSGIHQDANLALPLDRLHEMQREGRVGSVAPRHLSFMGSITATARLTRQSAPAAARVLVEDGVDIALLVPV